WQAIDHVYGIRESALADWPAKYLVAGLERYAVGVDAVQIRIHEEFVSIVIGSLDRRRVEDLPVHRLDRPSGKGLFAVPERGRDKIHPLTPKVIAQRSGAKVLLV